MHVGTTVRGRVGPTPRTAEAATLHPPRGHPIILASMEPRAHALLPHETVPRGPQTTTRGEASVAKATSTPSGQAVHTYSALEEADGRTLARELAAHRDGMPNLPATGNHATCFDGLQILFLSSTYGVTMHGPRHHGPWAGNGSHPMGSPSNQQSGRHGHAVWLK